jgi:NAD(P)-dependent dehydrogenase (short-subunit alcohol dehydrogenase family)
MSPTLTGRTVVVTGAARGIGRAMVELFLDAEARVVAADVDSGRLQSLRADLPQVTTVAADISSPSDCDRIIHAAGGRLDVLCNNAGILDRLALIDEVSDELWAKVIDVNLTGTFLLCRRAVRRMIDQGGGVIINTSSSAALGGGRAGPAYTASKAGVIALTQNIAVTCAEYGIRCNAILPGGTDTDMAHTTGGEALSERGLALLARLQGKPAPADPRQIAKVAVFLAGDDADRISGVALRVDAGVFAY